jgi:hypothetical protein
MGTDTLSGYILDVIEHVLEENLSPGTVTFLNNIHMKLFTVMKYSKKM